MDSAIKQTDKIVFDKMIFTGNRRRSHEKNISFNNNGNNKELKKWN